VALLKNGPEEPSHYVFMGFGPAAGRKGISGGTAGQHEAVTIAVAKKKGANAIDVTGKAMEKVDALRGYLLPSDVNVTVTRDYGETAREKSNELFEHMLIATISVIILIALALGTREALVVAENMHRHFQHHGVDIDQAVKAVDQVGNPTILATWTVIAALLPMAFISGFMGPYMRPLPRGASAAMLFSLLVAFIVNPWIYEILEERGKRRSYKPEKDFC